MGLLPDTRRCLMQGCTGTEEHALCIYKQELRICVPTLAACNGFYKHLCHNYQKCCLDSKAMNIRSKSCPDL